VIRAMQTFEIEMVLGPPFNFWVFGTKIYLLVAQVPPEFAPATALAAIAFLLITPLIFLHRWLLTRTDYTSITGRERTSPTPLGRWRYPIFAVVGLLALAITALPVMFLVAASCMKLFGFFNIAHPWTLSHWHEVLTGDFFVQSLLNTLELAGGGACVSIVLCSLVAYFTVRSRFVGRGALDFLSWLPFAIPGILLGVGLLYVFLGNPLLRAMYGGIPLMILATVIAGMTLGVQILKATMVQLGAGLEEAARTSGASWWYGFRHVIVPILMPTLVLVGVVNFIAAARDIASVALLATNASKTLSLLQLDYMIDGRSEEAAVVSVVVIGLTTGVAFLARILGLRLGLR
jgi:iron(III) transport system permease protein